MSPFGWQHVRGRKDKVLIHVRRASRKGRERKPQEAITNTTTVSQLALRGPTVSQVSVTFLRPPLVGVNFMDVVGTMSCLRLPAPELCAGHSDFPLKSALWKGRRRVTLR